MTDDLPFPALLNCWKHHAGWVRARVERAAREGEAAVAELPREMLVVGTRLMDFYTGALAPAEIAEDIFAHLDARGAREFAALSEWLAGSDGYVVLEVRDGSRWAVRLGPEAGRYVHLHPARRSVHTLRVHANALRTAALVVAHAGRLEAAVSLKLANEVRARYLALEPMRELCADGGVGAVLAALEGH